MSIGRREVRYAGAAAALAMAVIYYLIGLGILYIGTGKSGEMVDLGVFGGGAGTLFLLTAALLRFVDRRWLWVVLLVVQILVYAMYIAVSGSRVPAFEAWGITLRVIQLVLVAALAHLSWNSSSTRATTEVTR